MRAFASLAALVSLALLSGCAAEHAPSDPDATPGDPQSSAAQSAEADEYVPNHIIMGREGVRVAPDIQCSIFDENTISIAGSGALDAEIEFTFDVFDQEGGLLRVQLADREEWLSTEKIAVRIETETRVTGLTDLVSQTTGESIPVSFAFTCE